MNTEETNLVRSIMLVLGKIPGVRIFRNNVGTAYIGRSKQFTKAQTVNVQAGDVLIQSGRIFKGGLCVGSSDLIGLKSVTVTPEMIGQKVAIFMAVEAKTKTGRASAEQIAFVNMVNNLGGVGMIVKSEDEAMEFLIKK